MLQQAWFQTEEWCRALNLSERLALLTEAASESPASVDEVAAARLQRWRSEPPFEKPETFARKLELAGTTEAELLSLLGETAEQLHQRLASSPAWLNQLEAAFSPAAVARLVDIDADRDGFLNLVEPLVVQGRARLHAGIEALQREFATAPFRADEAEAMLVDNLYAQFPAMIERTLVLELNVARLCGHLEGATAEERFASFMARLRNRETAINLLQEYPVLARQLVICVNHWAEFSLEFLRRLCEDLGTIRSTLTPDREPGLLAALSGGVGDGHARGRSVLIAKFDTGFRVVYKPKSVAVVEHFQDLLGWLNDHGAEPKLRRIGVVERGTHGWIEFVAHEGCTEREQVARFYQRQGAYLALFYALEATDFHSENVIASGEHPVPIDLEALFHPRTPSVAATDVDSLAREVMNHSVTRVGLLPEFVWNNDAGEGVDISGFGDCAGQMSPHGVPDWDRSGTDEMQLIRRRMPMEGSQNRPQLNGADVEVLDYLNDIVVGFTNMYRLIETRREELLSPTGPLARFAGDDVRVVIRATRTYAVLLHESFHPDVLRDALDRDRMFDRMYGWLGTEPYLAKVINSELDDLNLGDIPIFSTRPDSRDLWDSMGRPVRNFFDMSGLELVDRLVRGMGDEDLERQLWFIRASFAMLAGQQGFVEPAELKNANPSEADPMQLLAAARAVGDRLDMLALRCGNEATWLGLLNIKETQWSISPLGLDLYGGLPGVALFLAYLGDVAKEPRYTDLARRTLATIRRQSSQADVRWVGAFDGLSGVVYLLTHLGTLWNETALLREADEIITKLPSLIEADEQLDIISGSAGCIGVLLGHYDRTHSSAALAAATRCGERLLAQAIPAGAGMGWIMPAIASKPLAGFSHGAAGVAWALLQLAARTGDDRFRRTALAGIAYERSLFSPRAGNWLDIRDFDTDCTAAHPPHEHQHEHHAMAWCHGAPGIGQARLGTLAHLDDAMIRREIDVALRTTLSSGFGHTPTLCHGDLGNLDLLLQAGTILGEPHWHAEANRRAAVVLDGIEADGHLCATPLGVESPGLMTGLAGIGYGLLRLADPKRIPSVLSLASPIAATSSR